MHAEAAAAAVGCWFQHVRFACSVRRLACHAHETPHKLFINMAWRVLQDEHLFPFGFGEENDFALRAGQAGFRRVVVPWVYIYHHKTKSYTVGCRAGAHALSLDAGGSGGVGGVKVAAVPQPADGAYMEVRSLCTSLGCACRHVQASLHACTCATVLPAGAHTPLRHVCPLAGG